MAKVPLSVDFVGKNDPTPEPVQGRLYFVEGEKSLYKDAVHGTPFSGINRVIGTTAGGVTTLSFYSDYGEDLSHPEYSIQLASAHISELVSQVQANTAAIANLNLTNASVINLDKVAPKPSGQHWTLSEGIAYVAGLSIDKNSVGLIFNNGTTSKIYFYTDPDLTQINDLSKWRDVQVGSGIEVITYGNRLSFPPVGTSDVLYMVSSDEEAWFWDATESKYKKVGVNIENIKLIDSNFNENYTV